MFQRIKFKMAITDCFYETHALKPHRIRMIMMRIRKSRQHPFRSSSLVSPSSIGMIAMPPPKYTTNTNTPIKIERIMDIPSNYILSLQFHKDNLLFVCRSVALYAASSNGGCRNYLDV